MNRLVAPVLAARAGPGGRQVDEDARRRLPASLGDQCIEILSLVDGDADD